MRAFSRLRGFGALAGLLSCLAAFSGCGEQAPGNRDGAAGAAGGGVMLGNSGSGGDLAVAVTGAAGAGGDDCHRDVSLTAVTLGTPPPFDLVIVADHSQSLAWSRDELSAGLGNLLRDARGRD